MKMKSGLWALLLLPFTLASCVNVTAKTNDDQITRTLPIEKKFSGLQAASGMTITYTQNKSASKAVISGTKEIVEGMTYKVNSDGVLKFEYPKSLLKKKQRNVIINIVLNGDLLYNYEASSAGKLIVTTRVESGKDLNFDVSSAGNITMQKSVSAPKSEIEIETSSASSVVFLSDLIASEVDIESSSSSSVSISKVKADDFEFYGSSVGNLTVSSGNVSNFLVSVSSGSGAKVEGCTIGKLKAKSSSGSDIKFTGLAAKETTAAASSGGSIKLAGETLEASLSAASGGSVNTKNLKIGRVKNINSSSGGSVRLSN